MVAFALSLHKPDYFGKIKIDPVTKKEIIQKAPKGWAIRGLEHFDMNSDYEEILAAGEQKLINFNNYLLDKDQAGLEYTSKNGRQIEYIILFLIILVILVYKKNSIKKLLHL